MLIASGLLRCVPGEFNIIKKGFISNLLHFQHTQDEIHTTKGNSH